MISKGAEWFLFAVMLIMTYLDWIASFYENPMCEYSIFEHESSSYSYEPDRLAIQRVQIDDQYLKSEDVHAIDELPYRS